MSDIENLISALDYILDTQKKKAHCWRDFSERIIALRRLSAHSDDNKK